MDQFNSLIFAKMSEHYESMLESGNLSDVVLVADDKELHAHKAILSARSPVFGAMFAHRTKKAQENRVEIVDVQMDVLKMLVRYVYTGKVESLDRYAADLFVAADKYQIDCLKTICKHQLLSKIKTDSVSDLLIFADLYQVTELNTGDLKLKYLDYIVHNGLEVMSSAGWKKILAKTDLLDQIVVHFNSMYGDLLNVYDDMKKKKTKDNRIDWVSFAKLLIDCSEPQLCYLFSICEQQQLLPEVSAEFVNYLLTLADIHQVTDLTDKCLSYITDNGLEVKPTDTWEKIVKRADWLAQLFEHLSIKFERVLFDK